MILLADSNVFISYWKAGIREKKTTGAEQAAASEERKTIEKIMSANEVMVCGVVRSELLQGAISEKNYREIGNQLDRFETLNLGDSDWDNLGHQLFEYRTNAFNVPFTDAAIACIAMKYKCAVWADDKHFDMMKSVISELQVYRTEELLNC